MLTDVISRQFERPMSEYYTLLHALCRVRYVEYSGQWKCFHFHTFGCVDKINRIGSMRNIKWDNCLNRTTQSISMARDIGLIGRQPFIPHHITKCRINKLFRFGKRYSKIAKKPLGNKVNISTGSAFVRLATPSCPCVNWFEYDGEVNKLKWMDKLVLFRWHDFVAMWNERCATGREGGRTRGVGACASGSETQCADYEFQFMETSEVPVRFVVTLMRIVTSPWVVDRPNGLVASGVIFFWRVSTSFIMALMPRVYFL